MEKIRIKFKNMRSKYFVFYIVNPRPKIISSVNHSCINVVHSSLHLYIIVALFYLNDKKRIKASEMKC